MNKSILYIAFIFYSFVAFGQSGDKEAKNSTWKKEKDYLKYQKEKEYEGPEDWYAPSPSSIKEEDNYSNNSSTNPSNQGIQYSPQRIQQDRDKQFGGYDRGGGKGDLKFDPKVKRPDPITLPKPDPIDIDAPNLPDIDPPIIPIGFWKALLFIILFIVIILLVHLWLKNRKPSDKKIVVDVENNWNPEVISKTELELRLEDALSREDFREGVRIYFTFILKELIRKNWIRWKKDKTNYHYLLEMNGKPNVHNFHECVRIYDLIWYGEYEINKDIFELLQPTLQKYYQSLEPKNE